MYKGRFLIIVLFCFSQLLGQQIEYSMFGMGGYIRNDLNDSYTYERVTDVALVGNERDAGQIYDQSIWRAFAEIANSQIIEPTVANGYPVYDSLIVTIHPQVVWLD
jgi:hypothetical protein